MYYINTFFVFSIIGYIIERLLNFNRDSGILFGFWTPIYGIGVCTILYIFKLINKKIKPKGLKKIAISFLIGFIILTILESFGGFIVERLFRISFWDYSNELFHIGKYTSLKMALIWGISSIFTVFILEPIIDKHINKIPRIITYILITLFSIDFIITTFPYITK